MSKILVRPARPIMVLNEDNTFFAQGEWVEVENTPYIRRRLKDGDLEQKPVPARAAGKAVAAKPDGDK